ncbi:hypothetical protein ACG0Z6_13270 [Roseateles sp. BYS180W]|uniref:Uncharacterized protein n=1 Tax=Roseateles rivi TaxID=3299028 RepID=A0ABW7FXX1_9BURK
MSVKTCGNVPACLASPAAGEFPHYLRRVARVIVLRAALRGRIGWPVALLVLNKIGGQA